MATRSVSRCDENDDPRHFGTSTDDTAIYLEDTMDAPMVRCISSSPSAVAILSPQQMPTCGAADLIAYDGNHLGALPDKSRRQGRPLSDLTNARGAVRLFAGKSPTPRRAISASSTTRLRARNGARASTSNERVADEDAELSPMAVSLPRYEATVRERNRLEKMYEHQKALYEEMATKQTETYASLQEKIMEVVALSTRNEENKRFIRQLKRETADSRTRVVAIQNRALEETRQEKTAREHYQQLLSEHEDRHASALEQHEAKVAGLESLLKDVTSIRGETDRVQVAQLDALLKAAYAKNTSLFADLLRQGRQIDLLFDSKTGLERQLDHQRRERRELEAAWAEERRRMMEETSRYAEQSAEQQRVILDLRQMLIRALEPRTPRRRAEDEEDTDSTSSSYSSGDEEDEEAEEAERGKAQTETEETRNKKERAQPPQSRVGSRTERRGMDLAALSAQVQSKLKSLPSGRI